MRFFNQKRLFFTFLVLLFGILVFYWHEWPPTQISKECSWVHKFQDEIPAKPGKSEAEIEACEQNGGMFCNLFSEPTPAQPAKDWWEEASPEEYSRCVRERGLKDNVKQIVENSDSENFYQSDEYGFSVVFPKGWNIVKPSSEDAQGVVQKAINEDSVISIAVRTLPDSVIAQMNQSNTIEDISSFEDFKRDTQKAIEQATYLVENFEFGKDNVDQSPAYWAMFSGRTSSDSKKETVKQYQFFYKNKLYMLSLTADEQNFSANTNVFDEVIESFNFTNIQ